ncbi:MAG TPA: hypothetical protein VLD86_18700 [Ilumatobacteraceae bacterium]|nr:hypothetical protein [Ilumatobacteraceae bacterium]
MTFTEGPTHERRDVIVEPPTTPMVRRAVVEQPVVEPVAGDVVVPVAPTPAGQVSTAYAAHFAPDAIIAALVGLVIMVVGLIAIVRGGFDGPMSDPVVSVVGFTHTTTLGLIEIGIGFCLLVSGATRSRSGELLFGAILGIGAFVGAVQTESFRESLALESGMAWLAVIAAAVVVLSALLMPRYLRHSTTIAQI